MLAIALPAGAIAMEELSTEERDLPVTLSVIMTAVAVGIPVSFWIARLACDHALGRTWYSVTMVASKKSSNYYYSTA